MAFKFSSSQLVDQLDDYIAAELTNCRVNLFVNNYVPDEASTTLSFTDPTFSGYAQKGNQNFGAASYVGTEAVATMAQQTWTVGATIGSDMVYGYYLTEEFSGLYRGGEAFAGGPVAMSTIGQILALTPKLTHANA